ncbi:MAG: histidine kinase dimerization/phosphoacceptor domain-containing protein [Chloroflexi bacterium]|nr:histidine kinase dimerization/phosphoacceptor domain-containing protein [Chloroflexota bacterium]
MADSLPQPSESAGADDSLEPTLHERLARLIHDDVLQSLGVSLLQAELCKRMIESDKPDDAIVELNGVVDGVEAAVSSLRHVMTELRHAGPT